MFTGWRPSPAVQYPSIGSIVSHELGPRNDLPPYVCIPSQPNSFAGTGYLGSAFGPFTLGSDPTNKEFKVRDLTLPSGIDEKRFADRRQMRAAVDRDLLVQLERQRRHRHAEGFQQGRPVLTDVAPGSEVVRPHDSVHDAQPTV